MKKFLFLLIAVLTISVAAYADEWCPLRGGTNDNTVTLSHTRSTKDTKVTVSLSHAEQKDVTVFVKVTDPDGNSQNVTVTITNGYTSAEVYKGSVVHDGIYSYDIVGSSCI